MNSKFLLLAFSLLFALKASSQVYFEKLYPNLSLQNLGTMDISPADNGYIFCGTQNYDYFVLKADSAGNTEWMNTYDSLGRNESCSAICHLSNGKFSFVGSGEYSYYDNMAVVGTLNTTGDSLHLDTYPVHDEGWGTYGIGIVPDTNGGYHFTMYEDGFGPDNFSYLDDSIVFGYDGGGSYSSYLSSNNNGVVYAMSSRAYFLWPLQDPSILHSSLGLDTIYQSMLAPTRIRATADNGFLIATENFDYTSNINDTAYLNKYDQYGTQQWSHPYLTNTSIQLVDVAEHPNGNLYLLLTEGISGNQRIELMVTTPTGDSIWSHFFYGYGTAAAKDLKIYPNGDLIIYGISNNDPYIIKTDSLAQINPNYSITGNGHVFCTGDTAILTVSSAASYLWSTGDTTQTIQLTNNTVASVTVTDGLGNSSTTANYPVQFNQPPTALISALDTIILCSASLLIDSSTTDPSQNFIWYRDTSIISHASSAYFSQSGMAKLIVSNNCGTAIDSAYVLVAPYQAGPSLTASPDVNICTGDSVLLVATGPAYPYLWSYYQDSTYLAGFNGDSIYVNRPGNYHLNYIGLYNCPSYYSNSISLIDRMPDSTIAYSGSTSICSGDSLQLSGNNTGGQNSYLWSDGSTTSSIYAHNSACYSYHISNTWGCSANSDTVCVNIYNVNLSLGSDTLYCINTTHTLNAGSGYSNYLWQDSTSNSTLQITSSIADTVNYFVAVTDTNGCSATDSVQVIFDLCAGLNESETSDGLSIYPNPSSGQCTFKLNAHPAESARLTLTDETGRIIICQSLNQNQTEITVDKLASGIYTVILDQENVHIGKLLVVE